jgi:hypothetical protein
VRFEIRTIDPGFGIELMALAAIVRRAAYAKQVASGLIEEAAPTFRA